MTRNEGSNAADFVECAFCGGKGVDPFGVMSPGSVCEVCGGTGNVRVPEPRAVCAFCAGHGVRPGSRLSCGACSGKGVQTVAEHLEPCGHCRSTGHEPLGPPLYCGKCHGVGLIPIHVSA
ncbi:MAG: hypothetical protein ACOYEV_14790 [Candidatus Nanopelagicales bacterium]